MRRNLLIKDIYKHCSILAAHIAKDIVEQEKIDEYCKTPCDLAVISHDKKYVNKDLFNKMMFHIAEYEFIERRGEVFVLESEWKRFIPTKLTSQNKLREIGSIQIYLLQQIIAKKFLEIIRNETQKIELEELIYYIDVIDGSKGLDELRSDMISNLLSINSKLISSLQAIMKLVDEELAINPKFNFILIFSFIWFY